MKFDVYATLTGN